MSICVEKGVNDAGGKEHHTGWYNRVAKRILLP